MAESSIWERLGGKGLESQFLWELEHGFELSPRESDGILEAVKLIFGQEPEFEAGKTPVWVVALDQPAGKSLSELKKVSVWVTLDAGKEDLEVYKAYGSVALRRVRILRITTEIVDGGGVPTQEDLSRWLHVDCRTIRRDLVYLRTEGYQIITRGVWCDIGKGTTHRVIIVKLFLQGFTYTEICRQTRHSAKAVKRYIQTFGRVVCLIAKGIKEPKELGFYVGVSERLAAEYLALYDQFKDNQACGARIRELIHQISNRPEYVDPKKVLMEGV